MSNYRDDVTYKTLERIIQDAGVIVRYEDVPDNIYARTRDSLISMPREADMDAITACIVLGHEMAHILTGLYTADDEPSHTINEATCDMIGSALYKLAEMITGADIERQMLKAIEA